MSEMPSASLTEQPERRYELRRRRVRRKSLPTQDAEYQPRDSRLLRVVFRAILAGAALVVMLACAVGDLGLGTPGVSVAEGQSGVEVSNNANSSMRVAGVSLLPPSVGAASSRAGQHAELTSLKGSRFLFLVGFSHDPWPLEFWVGSVRAARE